MVISILYSMIVTRIVTLHLFYSTFTPSLPRPFSISQTFLLSTTHLPNSSQTSLFSITDIPAANPLVVVATKTLAPSHPSTLPKFIPSSCHPYLNSSFRIPRPTLTLQTASQILFPTRHTASGLFSLTFASNTGTPASISFLLSMLASRVGRSTIFVFPMLYNSGSLYVSEGGCRMGVIPDQWRSFQKRLLGCA